MASTLSQGNVFTDNQTIQLFLKQRLRGYPLSPCPCFP